MGAATADRKTVAEMRAAKAEREAAEQEKAGRAEIDAAHAKLGTGEDVAGSEHFDDGPQDIHGGDGLDEGGGEPSPPAPGAQLSFAVGGKKPTATGLRLVGGKIDVDGSFSKGQTIEMTVIAVVGEVAFVDQVDAKTSQVVGCERRHKARIKSVTVL